MFMKTWLKTNKGDIFLLCAYINKSFLHFIYKSSSKTHLQKKTNNSDETTSVRKTGENHLRNTIW